MDERHDERPIHALELECWLSGDQEPGARARTEARLALAERARLQSDDQALRERLLRACPPDQFAARVRARVASEPTAGRHAQADTTARTERGPVRGARIPAWSFAVAGALVACLLVLRGSRREGALPTRAPASERSKGLELELRVYRKRGGTIERLQDGSEAQPRDVVQLGYVRAEFGFGVLLSIDGRGAVTLHQPRGSSGSTALSGPPGEQLLDEAYELDDAPAFERFVLVASARPLSAEAVMRAARQLAANPERARREPLLLSLPTTQRSLVLHKRAAP